MSNFLRYNTLNKTVQSPIVGAIDVDSPNTIWVKQLDDTKVDLYFSDVNGKVLKLKDGGVTEENLRRIAQGVTTIVEAHALAKGNYRGTADNLKEEIDDILSIVNVNDSDLNTLQRIVEFVKENKELLDRLSVTNIIGLTEALESKVDKVVGKDLSSNDFTNTLKSKLESIDISTFTVKGGYNGTAQDLFNLIENVQNILSTDNSSLNTLDKIADQIELLKSGKVDVDAVYDKGTVERKIAEYKPMIIKTVDNQDIKFKEITQSAYNALTTKDPNTYYLITQ